MAWMDSARSSAARSWSSSSICACARDSSKSCVSTSWTQLAFVACEVLMLSFMSAGFRGFTGTDMVSGASLLSETETRSSAMRCKAYCTVFSR